MSGQWRAVEGFDGYEVSSDGLVRSRKRGGEWRLLTQHPNSSGYAQVHLSKGPGSRSRRVHSLVAAAFIGPLPDGQETRHLDGDKTNNDVSNLAYGTRTQNRQDRIAHGSDHNLNKTHCRNGHPYSSENTRITPEGHRVCRTCHRYTAARYLRRKRDEAMAC